MKYLVTYKSKIDGKSRHETKHTLSDLTNFLLKVNYYTDNPETVDITSIKSFKH